MFRSDSGGEIVRPVILREDAGCVQSYSKRLPIGKRIISTTIAKM